MLTMLESFVLLHIVASGIFSGKFSCVLSGVFQVFTGIFLIEELYNLVTYIYSLTVRSSLFFEPKKIVMYIFSMIVYMVPYMENYYSHYTSRHNTKRRY
jgi:hypothetical protein